MRRMRGGLPISLVSLALVAGPAAPGQGQEAEAPPAAEPEVQAAAVAQPATWYARALAHSDVGIHVTHFWSKGPKLRSESVLAGRRIVTIVNGDTYYAYDGLGRRGLAIGRSPIAIRQDAERRRPFGNELKAVLRQGAEKVGLEDLGGREVEVFRVTDGMGRRQVWATTDELRIPLRIEVYRRQTGRTLKTEFLDWRRGLLISDEFFVPESGIAFLRLSFDEYVAKQVNREPLGPVPVLYTDLLHGY